MRPTVLVTPAMAVETLTVKTARLDELVAPAHKIDLVKVDVEGRSCWCSAGRARCWPATGRSSCSNAVRDRRPLRGGRGRPDLRLLEELGYAVSLMKRWLKGEPPFSAGEFQRQFSEGTNFYFLAYPRPT